VPVFYPPVIRYNVGPWLNLNIGVGTELMDRSAGIGVFWNSWVAPRPGRVMALSADAGTNIPAASPAGWTVQFWINGAPTVPLYQLVILPPNRYGILVASGPTYLAGDRLALVSITSAPWTIPTTDGLADMEVQDDA
jgi:hypothetical protein